MTNLVIAIALWCGNVNDNNHFSYISKDDINHCREQLFQCATTNPNGNGFLNCFKTYKLEGK